MDMVGVGGFQGDCDEMQRFTSRNCGSYRTSIRKDLIQDSWQKAIVVLTVWEFLR